MCKTLETRHDELANELQSAKEKNDELTKCRELLQVSKTITGLYLYN